jgi:hypothetical protein
MDSNRDNPHETILAQLDTIVTGTELDAMAGKLALIADGATANATDADLRDRTTHTGEQTIATITGLEARLDAIDDDFGDLSDVASSGSYGDLVDVPASFPPSPHSHGMGDVTGLGGALDLKANTADLGSAASAGVGDFATASQGALADTAVQPATVAGVLADRHTHANKATLDGIGSANLVPAPGVRGQVLTVGASGRVWQDVPGIVYPSLLLSPDGSFDRNGPVAPTVGAGVTVVPGQYGQAWQCGGSMSTGRVTYGQTPSTIMGTYIVRYRLRSLVSAQPDPILIIGAFGNGATDRITLGMTSGGSSQAAARTSGVTSEALGGGEVSGEWLAIAIAYTPSMISLFYARQMSHANRAVAPTGTPAGVIEIASGDARVANADIESVVWYPVEIPGSEIVRISTMATAWTMDNAAANVFQPQSQFGLFNPTHKTASGTTQFTSAPGVGTTVIASLSAGTEIEVSAGVRTVSSVSYTLVKIGTGETGYITTSQITAL